MKLIDNKGRLLGVINIVDLAVLAVIILLIGGLAYKFMLEPGRESADKTSKTYTVTVMCPMVPESAAEVLKEGDRIYYSGKYVNGTIDSVRYEDAKEAVVDAEGKYVTAVHPYLKDVYVTVSITGNASTRAIMLDKYQVNLGKDFVMKTTRVEIQGIVTDIQE